VRRARHRHGPTHRNHDRTQSVAVEYPIATDASLVRAMGMRCMICLYWLLGEESTIQHGLE